MTTQDLRQREWTARPLRPVARWVQRLEPDGVRLVMEWSVPELSPEDVASGVARA